MTPAGVPGLVAAAYYPYQDVPRGFLLAGRLAKTGHPPPPTGAALEEHQEVAGLCWPVSKRGRHTKSTVRTPGRKAGPCLTGAGGVVPVQESGLKPSLKEYFLEAGEVVQRLRALAALVQDPGLASSTYTEAHNPL